MRKHENDMGESRPESTAWLASILYRHNPAWLARYVTIRRRLRTMARGQRRWLLKRAAVSVTGAALLLALAQAPAAHAATITVDNGVVVIADDGQCSLPEAILNANTDSQLYATPGECEVGAGADTITLNGGTYTLTNDYGPYAYFSNNGLPVIESDITIDGNGATIERDGAAPDFRIMVVNSTGSLTLNNTTMSGGLSQEDGGALAVYAGGYALIQDSTFRGNEGDEGGAIQNEGVMVIDNTLIDNNYASDDGGGVSNEDGGDLTIRNGTVISNNYAYDSGGGVDLDGSSSVLTITDSTISGNAAQYGGGVYAGDGTATISSTTITGNDAEDAGGGISTYFATITIQAQSTISGNTTDDYGGGADFYLSDVTISDSEISGNTAASGGGIHSDGSTVTIERSLISDNHISQGGPPPLGGGIYNGPAPNFETGVDTPGEMTIIESTISGNSAFFGGGIFNSGVGGGNPAPGYESRVYIYSSTIDDNYAVYGGGLFNYGGVWRMANSTISGNEALGAGGGALNISDGPDPSGFYLSTVTGNVAGGYGGGIMNFYGYVFVAGSIVSGNSSTLEGSEIGDSTLANLTSTLSVLGDSSQTNVDAFYGFTPDVSDTVATSDGTDPTALASILDTSLANNGGPTETHALVSGSPAIDGVPSAYCDSPPLDVDQRGFTRNVDGDTNPSPDECDIGAYEYLGVPPTANICPVDPTDGTVGPELTTLLGTGMGSPTRSKMVAKITIPNSGDVVDLYGQMAGKEYNGVKYVRFIFGDKSYQQVQPETDLGDTGAISWWGDNLTTQFQSQAKPFVKGRWFLQKGAKKMRLPRAIVMYPTHETDTDYANAWSTFGYPDNFVAGTLGFDQTNTNVLGIPETQGTTDLTVQLAVTDVNRDPRTVDVTVRAGGVEETVTLTGPTNKKSELLNIFEVTLEDVPAGTDEVEIILESVLGEGDSAALLGAAAHYVCEPETENPLDPDSDSAFFGWGDIQTRLQAAPDNRTVDTALGRFPWLAFEREPARHHADRAGQLDN